MSAFPVPPYTAPRQLTWHAPLSSVAPMPGLRWIRIDPHLRGRVTPTTLAAMAARGLCVHQVGSAAHVHDPERRHRWILEIWAPGDPVPAFRARLTDHHRWLRRRGGAPLPAQASREAAADAAFRAQDRDIPWWKVRADW